MHDVAHHFGRRVDRDAASSRRAAARGRARCRSRRRGPARGGRRAGRRAAPAVRGSPRRPARDRRGSCARASRSPRRPTTSRSSSATTVRQQPLTAIDAPSSASSSTVLASITSRAPPSLGVTLRTRPELLDDAGEHQADDLVVEPHVGAELAHRRELVAVGVGRSCRARRTRARACRACRARAARRTRRAVARARRRARCPSSVPPPSTSTCSTPSRPSSASVSPRSTPVPPAPGATTSTFAPAARHASIAPGARRVDGDDERRARARCRTAARRPARDRARRASTRVGGCCGDGRDVAHGERGPIGERGAGADHDRLRVGAQLVRVGAGELRREPARRSVGGGDAAVDARRDLGDHERPAGAAVMEVRREIARGRARRRRRPSRRSPRRAAARSPAPATRGSGSSSAATTRVTPAAISASAHGGVRPWCEHGSSVTYAVAPRGALAGLRERADFGVRAARAARSRPSPTTSPSRTSTQPTHGLGAVRRRAAAPAASACSIASSSRTVPPRADPRGAATTTNPARAPEIPGATAENGVETLSHPDSDRRPRNHTWSAPGWRPGVRGLGPVPEASPPSSVVTAGRDFHPTPRAQLCCLARPEYQGRAKIATCSNFATARSARRPRLAVSAGGRRRAGRGRARRSASSTSKPSRAPLAEPGRLQISAAPRAPATPRESIPKPRPSPSLARRIASAMPGRLALDHRARALGREVAGPEAGAAGRDDEPGEAVGEVAERGGHGLDAVGAHAALDHLVAGRGQTLGEGTAARVVARPSATPSETVSTLARSVTTPRRGSRARPPRDRRRRRSRCPTRGCRRRPRPRAPRCRP